MTRLSFVAAAGLVAALVPVSQAQMFACQSSREYYSINLSTGAKTFLFNIGAGAQISASLAHDCTTGVSYVSSTAGFAGESRRIYTLNRTNGAVTLVGPYGDPAILMHAIEIDLSTGRLYGISLHDVGLYEINRTTGAATLVGLTGISGTFPFPSMAYNTDDGVMYSINAATDSLYRINLATGAATLIGTLNGPINCGGMAYNSDNHTMYMVDNDLDILYTVNLTTGAATPVGSTGVGNLIGLMYVPTVCPPPPVGCAGDLNGDNQVDIADLTQQLANFGTASGATPEDGDMDEDGDVDITDLATLLARFGTVC